MRLRGRLRPPPRAPGGGEGAGWAAARPSKPQLKVRQGVRARSRAVPRRRHRALLQRGGDLLCRRRGGGCVPDRPEAVDPLHGRLGAFRCARLERFLLLCSIASGIVNACSRKSRRSRASSAKTRVAESVPGLSICHHAKGRTRLLLAEFLALHRIGSVVSLCHGTWDADLVWFIAPAQWVPQIRRKHSPSPFLSHS